MLVNQRRLNSLDKRILRMVRYIIKKDQQINHSFGFTFLCDRTQSCVFRCIWLIIVVSCVGICLYQTTKRYQLYKEVPIAVDVNIREEGSFVFPALTVCTSMTDGITELLKRANGTQTSCYNVYQYLVSGVQPQLNVTYIWKKGDISKAATGTIQFKKVILEKPEKTNKEVLSSGTCTTFSSSTPYAFRGPDLKLIVEISNQEVGCLRPVIIGTTQESDERFNFRNMWLVHRNSEFSLSHAVTQYISLNHWKHPCSSREAFFQCAADCKKDIFGKMPCKFPFIPEEVNIPWCPVSPESENIYKTSQKIFLNINPRIDCNCNRMCVVTQREELRMFLSSNTKKNSTIITMQYGTNSVNVFTERIAYDLISFLSDVGGNTGLYLGLSLLSVLELTYRIIYWVYSASLKPKFSNSDPIFKKVLSVYHKCSGKGNTLKIWSHPYQTNNCDNCSNIKEDFSVKSKKTRFKVFVEGMHYVFLFIGFVFCVGLCVERIMYFSKRPSYTTTELIENQTMAFPTLTVCWPSKAIISLRKKKAELQNVDYYDIDYLDLLNSKMDAMHLWNISNNKNEFIKVGAVVKNLQKLLPKNITQRSIPFYESTCQQFTIAPIKYSGWTSFMVLLASYKGTNRDEFITLYYNTPGEDPDVTSYELLPANCSTEISFVVKKQLKDSSIAPCANLEEVKNCKRNCLQQRLSKISCRLPYMNLIKNLPLCSTPATAKKSRAVYQDVLLTTDEIEVCKCLRKCSNVAYMARVFVLRTEMGYTSMTFTFPHPYIQTLSEVSAYRTEKLFCDIGSILGITMGLSVYSTSVLVRSIYPRMFSQHVQ